MLIPNAGLVLLAPFLEHLFVRLGLVVGRGTSTLFCDQAAISRGVSALQYLANGPVDPADQDMALSGILCGVAPGPGVPGTNTSPDADAETCDELLGAVIARWSSLSQTSLAGLREAFLQRGGQLTRNGVDWTLRIEREPLDILVDQVPWTYALIQYPWMPGPIHVTW